MCRFFTPKSNQDSDFEAHFKLIHVSRIKSTLIPMEKQKKLRILSYYNVHIMHIEMNAELKTIENA